MAITYSRYVIKDVFTNADGVEVDHYYCESRNGYVSDITEATQYKTVTEAHGASVAVTEELVEIQVTIEIGETQKAAEHTALVGETEDAS